MSEPVFISRATVEMIHRSSLEQHGGQDGIRDETSLESALAQPMHVFYYAQADLCAIAAAYAFHLAENQPFIDGNKRTAIATALLFLEGNGARTLCLTDDLALRRHDRHRPKAHRQDRLGRDFPPSSFPVKLLRHLTPSGRAYTALQPDGSAPDVTSAF